MKLFKIDIKVFMVAVFVFCGSKVWAVPMALVYENEAAVLGGQASLGTVTAEGVVISAKLALASPNTLLIGFPQEPLKKAKLLKLDVTLDLALIQAGDPVADEKLQKAFSEKADSLMKFLPQVNTSISSTTGEASANQTVVVTESEPYQIKFNDQVVGNEPVQLSARFKKSKTTFELVRVSSVPVWYVSIEITAEPKLSFWKENQPKGLSDVPSPTFHYQQQILFVGFANGRSIKFPLGIYFIKDEKYVFHVKVESKNEVFNKDIPVVFKVK